jgi:hypothetical protein
MGTELIGGSNDMWCGSLGHAANTTASSVLYTLLPELVALLSKV